MAKKDLIDNRKLAKGGIFCTALRSFIVLLLFSLLSACGEPPPIVTNDNTPARPVKYIAKLETGQQADGVLVKFLASSNAGSRARSLSSAGLTERAQFGLVPGLKLAAVSNTTTINSTLSALANDPNVAYAEPNYIYTIDAVPNDPDFGQQWGLNNGANTDINAPEAWDTGTGNNSVIVAVIDSGVDYNHPDLRNQIWNNSGEIAGNNRDDDGNGFVDDIRGWDFESNDNDPMDENNHGTHVAGIIGAQGNDNRGIAGVNWTVQIMPLKFMNPQGSGTTAAAIGALDYAVSNGATISNNSWGGGAFSQALFDAIQRANSRGHLFVAAAGNDGVNNDNTSHYPSSYNLPNIISVASTNQAGSLSGFSNFGNRTVDLAAPGSQILSTVRNGGYQSFSGTSMASPFVAGVAGLLLGQNPNLSVVEIIDAILNNVTAVGALSGQVSTGGRLNAQASITSIPSSTPGTPPGTPTAVNITSPGITTLAVGNTLRLNVTGGTAPYSWQSTNNAIASINTQGLISAISPGSFQITAQDSNGVTSSPLDLVVSAVPTQAMTILPANVTQINLNASQTFTISGGTPSYTWRSSNATVASIQPTANGLGATVNANQAGSFTMTITDAAGAAITSTTIQVVGNNTLNISAPKSTLNIGETTQLIANGGTSPYTWRSSSAGVASVDNGGLVSALGAGTTSISITDSAGTQTSINIRVINNTGSNLVVTPNNSAVSIGTTTRLKATGGGLQISWTSSSPAIASIDDRGIVKALAPGVTTISATDENGNRGTSTFEVRELTIAASVKTIGAGDTLQLSVEGGAAPYVWSVDKPNIASINSSGLLTTNAGTTGGILVTATDTDDISKSIIVTINNSTALRAPRSQ